MGSYYDEYGRVHMVTIDTANSTIHILLERQNPEFSVLVTWTITKPKQNDFKMTNFVAPPSNEKTITFTLSYGSVQSGDYYIGLLPYTEEVRERLERNDVNSAFNSNAQPRRLDYKITVFISKCLYHQMLPNTASKWTDEGCRVGPDSNISVLHCICDHMSVFGGSSLAKQNTVNLKKILVVLKVYRQNWIIIIFMSAWWLLYGILLLVLLCRDWGNPFKILVLPDDLPKESYPYIIKIYTGIRCGSGTKAKVRIQLHGKNSSSRMRRLYYPKNRLFRNGSEDWFVFRTIKPLGNIRAITIEHDNTGKNPDWFLSQVRVFDPKKRRYWLFLVDSWFTSNPRKGLLSQCVPAVPNHELGKFAVVFRQRAIMELRKRHIWLSIIRCPQRSSFTRPQRLTCAFVILTLAMLSNVFLFKMIPDDGDAEKPEQILNIYGFKFNFYPIIFGIGSSAIAYLIGFFLIRSFSMVRSRYERKLSLVQLAATDHWEARSDSLGSLASSEMSGELREDLDKESSNDQLSEHHEDDNDALRIFHRNVFTDPRNTILHGDSISNVWGRDIQAQGTASFVPNVGCGDSNHHFSEDVADPLYPIPLMVRTALPVTDPAKEMVLSDKDFDLDIEGVKKRSKFGFQLAWYFVYVAWILAAATAAASTFFIIKTGKGYHERKSLIWLVSNLTSFLFGMVLLDPLQVIIAIIIMCYRHNPSRA